MHDADEVGSDSKSARTASKSQLLERIPTVEEQIPCTVFDAAESSRTKYFNMAAESSSTCNISKVTQESAGSDSELPSRMSESMLEEFVQRLDQCIVSEQSSMEVKKKCIQKQERISIDSDTIPDSEVDNSMSASSKIMSSPNVGLRSRTPPLSEMIPYSMSPPVSSVSSVKSVIAPKVNGLGVRTIFFSQFIHIFAFDNVAQYLLENYLRLFRIEVLIFCTSVQSWTFF